MSKKKMKASRPFRSSSIPAGGFFGARPGCVSQAQEFINLIRYLGDEIELDIRGDGLLSHILNVGAELADLQEIKSN